MYVREGRLKVVDLKKSTESKKWAECFLANDVFFYALDNKVRALHLCFMKVKPGGGNNILNFHV